MSRCSSSIKCLAACRPHPSPTTRRRRWRLMSIRISGSMPTVVASQWRHDDSEDVTFRGTCRQSLHRPNTATPLKRSRPPAPKNPKALCRQDSTMISISCACCVKTSNIRSIRSSSVKTIASSWMTGAGVPPWASIRAKASRTRRTICSCVPHDRTSFSSSVPACSKAFLSCYVICLSPARCQEGAALVIFDRNGITRLHVARAGSCYILLVATPHGSRRMAGPF